MPIIGIGGGRKHVYILLDSSGSMALGDKISQAKKGALAFCKDATCLGYSVGLISFACTASLLCDSEDTIEILESTISSIRLGSETHMAKAIDLARQRLKSPQGTKTIVLVTDGIPNGPGDPKATLDAAAAAKVEGIEIITIGTDDADEKFLRALATKSELSAKVLRVQLREAIVSSLHLLWPGIAPTRGRYAERRRFVRATRHTFRSFLQVKTRAQMAARSVTRGILPDATDGNT